MGAGRSARRLPGERRALRTRSDLRVGLLDREIPHDLIVLPVERAERRAKAEGGGPDQRVEQAEAVGQVELLEESQSPVAVAVRGPDHRERGDQLPSPLHLVTVLGVLDQFHDHQARHHGWLGQVGAPLDRGRVAALDVDQNVGIQQKHAGEASASGMAFGLAPQAAGVRCAVADVEPVADEPFAPPVLDHLGARPGLVCGPALPG